MGQQKPARREPQDLQICSSSIVEHPDLLEHIAFELVLDESDQAEVPLAVMRSCT